MPPLIADRLPGASVAILDYILAALGDADPCPLGGNTGLPEGSVECLEQNIVIAPTPIVERVFDAALLRFARTAKRDLVLVRHGFHPETLNPVLVDVAVRTISGPILIPDMSLFRHPDGGLHLVPAKPDLFAEINASGLDLSMVVPWNCWDERAEGLERAAAEIVRACRPRGR